MATSKVVRLEDVLETHYGMGASPVELLSAGVEATNGSFKSTVSAMMDGELQSTTSSGSMGATPETEEEAQEKVFELPENWPRIKQLERPASCMLSKSRMPCVRKAVSHLELIQNIIDEWLKRVVDEVNRRSSISNCTSIGPTPQQNMPRKQLRFRDPSTRGTTAIERSSSGNKSRLSTASLSVSGIGFDLSDLEAEQLYSQQLGGLMIPYLGAEDIIEEVITLLARLETDRQDTNNRFLQECLSGNLLRKKIDELCLRRLRELPILVQREHEACIMDLNELHWHVAYKQRARDKAMDSRNKAETRNKLLKEEISFIKQHIPLVQEKLVLELEAMDKIKKAQVETNQELMTTKQRQAKTEQKYAEAVNKAAIERGHIKRELDTVRENLQQISKELSDAEMLFDKYEQDIKHLDELFENSALLLQELEVENTDTKKAEAEQATKVFAVKAKVTEAQFEFKRLENENSKAEDQLQIMKSRNSAKLQALENKLTTLKQRLLALKRSTDQWIIEIKDIEEKLQKCMEQKVIDEKNIRRILREQENVNANIAVTVEEYERVFAINQNIKNQLSADREKAFSVEEALKNSTEAMKKQVKEEIHTQTIMQAKISSEKIEMDKALSESRKKQDKAEQVIQDIESAVDLVLEKVKILRQAKEKRNKQISDLQDQIEETKIKHEDTLKQFEEKLIELTPHQGNLKQKVEKMRDQLDKMKWKTDMMTKKIDDMDEAQKMMIKVIVTTEEAINEIEYQIKELTQQLESHRIITASLKAGFITVQVRQKDMDMKHQLLTVDRSAVLSRHDLDILKYIEKNKELASLYRQLQNEFMITKEQLLRNFDDRLMVETTIGDVKQLQGLQSKLQGALTEYFKLSGLYNEGELARLQVISNVNGIRVGRLQQDMEEALRYITTVLQNDVEHNHTMAWETGQRMRSVSEESKNSAVM